jgi:cytochrome c2
MLLEEKLVVSADYKYSKALASYDKDWTFEELNGFLKKPASYIKGTKMSYAGLRKEKDRASIIKYLNQNSDSPKAITLIYQNNIIKYFFEHELC